MLFIFVLPLVGVLGYLLVRGHTIQEHQAHDQAQLLAFRQFQRSGAGPVDDLHKLDDLHDRGVLTYEEFERAKAKVLA